MACCLLIAALFTRFNEWLHRHGLAGDRRTALFPNVNSPIPSAQGGSR